MTLYDFLEELKGVTVKFSVHYDVGSAMVIVNLVDNKILRACFVDDILVSIRAGHAE